MTTLNASTNPAAKTYTAEIKNPFGKVEQTLNIKAMSEGHARGFAWDWLGKQSSYGGGMMITLKPGQHQPSSEAQHAADEIAAGTLGLDYADLSDDDFKEIGIGSLRDALIAAFEAGQAAAK